jgi:hypothetical protein
LREPDDIPDWHVVAKEIASTYRKPATGRPSGLADVRRLFKLLSLISRGNYLETAARAAGFSKQSIYSCRRLAETGDAPAIAFVDALERAEALAEVEAVDAVRRAGQAGPQFWAAAMTRLERRHPDRWGRRQDDAGAPKVIVQIGIKDSDVSIAPLDAVTKGKIDPGKR